TDLYAVGVILYESVTGQLPFNGVSATDLLFQIALSTPPPIASLVADVDPGFCSIVEKAMARDPAARFQTGAEFIAALDAWAASGQGVAVPAPTPGPGPAYPPTAQLAVTPGPAAGTPWASSQGIPAPPTRSPVALIAVLVAVVAVLGLGGALLLLRGRATPSAASGSGPATTTAASPTASSPASTPTAAPSPGAPPEPVVLAPETTPPAPSATASAAPVARPGFVPPRRGGNRPTEPTSPPASPSSGYNPFGHL
ncbi:MAG TPA: hypothetical protein VHS09_16975, partial [Polyangiaceae bacterium]|nr:hypothetical protein [Polyangiaceae bacterium]